MNKNLLLFISFIFLSIGANAQKNKVYDIELYNKTSTEKALAELARAETDFWNAEFGFDSTMESRVYYSSYSTYLQMLEIMKQLNFKMEKNLLQEYYSFKIRRERFMKTFLNDTQFSTFKKIVDETAKKELASYTDQPSKEISGLRNIAAGWNVLGHTLTFR